MGIDHEKVFENLARLAVSCRACFDLKEVQAPDMDVAQPRWIGRGYWAAPDRVAILMCNPGQSPADTNGRRRAAAFLEQMESFRNGATSLRTLLDDQRGDMPLWGKPAGRFTRFYEMGLGLDLDKVAFANVAWCPTASNTYPRSMLDRCFSRHTGPLLRLLQPSILIASGSQARAFISDVRDLLPKTQIIEMLHYAHREGGVAERRELRRVRLALNRARLL